MYNLVLNTQKGLFDWKIMYYSVCLKKEVVTGEVGLLVPLGRLICPTRSSTILGDVKNQLC